jgi:hypothetical protein
MQQSWVALQSELLVDALFDGVQNISARQSRQVTTSKADKRTVSPVDAELTARVPPGEVSPLEMPGEYSCSKVVTKLRKISMRRTYLLAESSEAGVVQRKLMVREDKFPVGEAQLIESNALTVERLVQPLDLFHGGPQRGFIFDKTNHRFLLGYWDLDAFVEIDAPPRRVRM